MNTSPSNTEHMKIDPALDPEISTLLEKVQPIMAAIHRQSALQMRETLQALRVEPTEVESMHEIREIDIPAKHGYIKSRLYKPVDTDNLPVLIWFHGGGWVLGDLDSADMTCRDLAAKSECMVLSIDYRLAPEHPFPAAFDDSVTALRWTFENASMLGANINRIAIGGDSAGANLAACACIATKDLDIKFQLLVYPVIEADFANESYTRNADNYFLTRDLMKWFWNQYVPDPAVRNDQRVAPLEANLTGLPPAWLLTVHYDPLRDEGIKYAEALTEAGGTVESEKIGNAVHGFFSMPTKISVTARNLAASKLKKALM